MQATLRRHDVFFAHYQQFVTVDLDGAAGVFAEQDLVADLDVDREQLAFFVLLAGANGQYFALVRLLGSGIRESRYPMRFSVLLPDA